MPRRAKDRRSGRWWVALLAGGLLFGTALVASAQAAPIPFRGAALWLSPDTPLPAPAVLASNAEGLGVRSLYLNAGEGSTADPSYTPALVHSLEADGISVCAWTFVYGTNPQAEAAVAVAAVRAGADCLAVDAEGMYDGRYGSAQTFVRTVRAAVGRRFPIGLAGQAEVTEHPTFPYSVFLGPGGFTFNLPQIYWHDFGISVDQAFRLSLGENALYGRPIVPVGQLYGGASPAQVERFRELAGAYGCPGLSFYGAASAPLATLAAVAAPVLRAPRQQPRLPTFTPGADGDEIVWAQELLDAGGARLTIGGYFGQPTAHAVAQFQRSHHLAPSGHLTPATWALLMRRTPVTPSWQTAPPLSASLG